MSTTSDISGWYAIYPDGSAWIAIQIDGRGRMIGLVEESNVETFRAARDDRADIAGSAATVDNEVDAATAEAVLSAYDADMRPAMCCVHRLQ